MSLSSFTVKTAAGNNPYVGIPCFVSRAFRHTSIYVRTDRIKKPEDLKGKKVGVPEYQLTANVWARAILEDDHGVKPADIKWVRGAIEHAGRIEKITIKLPPGVALENAPEGRTISDLIDKGEIDGFIAPRPPHLAKPNPNVGWLFRDPVAAAKDYFKRTGIFPIMHLVGVRRTLVEQHPWLPVAVMKAFEQSKKLALEALERYVGDQGDAAVRRGDIESDARRDGRGLLALWARAKPQGAGDVPAPPSFARAVVAAGHAGGAVSSVDARDVQDLSFLLRRGRSDLALPLPQRITPAEQPDNRIGADRKDEQHDQDRVHARHVEHAIGIGDQKSDALFDSRVSASNVPIRATPSPSRMPLMSGTRIAGR